MPTQFSNAASIQLEHQFWSDSRRLVVLLMLARASGPLTAVQIARQACAANETVSDKLRSLAKMGLVVRPTMYGGWLLTRQGWQVLHPSENPPYPLPDGFILAEVADSAMEAGEDCPAPGPTSSEQNASSSAPIHPKVADSAMNPNPHVADSSQKTAQIRDVSLKKEESIKDSSSDLSDSYLMNQLSLAELLAYSHLLFGLPGVLPNRLPERPPQLVLGWLAQAYTQRHKLHSPAALVYKRLLSGDLPAAPYREHPERYLPREYLAAVHLTPPSYDTARDQADDDTPNEVSPGDGDGEDETLPPDPSLLALVNGRSILAAWEQAAALLRVDLSPANYHTYLEPTRPLVWQPPGTLVIVAPTPQARDWLASRLSRLLERLLVGLLAQQVALAFECEDR
jgi:hypothetical protein